MLFHTCELWTCVSLFCSDFCGTIVVGAPLGDSGSSA